LKESASKGALFFVFYKNYAILEQCMRLTDDGGGDSARDEKK
jgi:hypothetical protein